MQLLVVLIALLAALATAVIYGLGGTLVIHGVFQEARWSRSSPW